MGRYKGLTMPRAKKKKVEVARTRIIDSINTLDAENVQPSAILSSQRLPLLPL